MVRTARLTIVALTIAGMFASAASATETITYTYDAKGRLVQVVHTGTVNNQTCYKYDKCDNRTSATTTRAP